MLPIADQTAGPNGLKFFVDTHGGRGMFKAKKTNFFSKKIFTGNAGPLQLVLDIAVVHRFNKLYISVFHLFHIRDCSISQV